MDEQNFYTSVLSNPFNRELLRRLASLKLGQCYLTAGCLFQTVWNLMSGRDPDWGIKDYDIFYYDDDDLTWEAEDRVIRSVSEAVADLPIHVEVRNQARVHLWYSKRFGGEYPPLQSTRSGIDLYLISGTCVGINVQTLEVYATDGMDDLSLGQLRMNPRNPRPELFVQKAKSYQERWRWRQIVE
ncbi:nucleotidyltransferase family protein [Ochrobactrum quorumnocens]|uniref:nucleotidyltransferase family protein n=1 Tax=Ochrobactrum quorumnocens TaxID=271865 RepID=UPI000BA83B34|nr:nucleotidyltransferase family protein [[Ochrobactrum] quorumnocens]